eukprot:CAMPEP_0170478862 /NCGR_PEP_ID=MMETSP0208-20121228/300_1 /TAXON_ID=197538 /ORGANISM="Strombidium inclinatum, Strain S3" /LENGTH=71 /DNA_ID=CAMNT_0010751191 /DNA_START=231 /DNA_END=446 /DNA_ORIENTATION=-
MPAPQNQTASLMNLNNFGLQPIGVINLNNIDFQAPTGNLVINNQPAVPTQYQGAEYYNGVRMGTPSINGLL